MATTSTMIGTVPPGPGLGLVLVEFDYEYKGRDGVFVRIKPNERYELLSKTTSHWWQVRTGPGARPFYIPAKYVRELPEVPPLLFYDPIGPETIPAASPAPLPVHIPVPKTLEETRSKSSDEVTIRLRAEGGYRKQENRMSTFGVPADFQDVVPNRGLALRTTNGSGTTNMGDGLRPQAQGDSKKNRVTGFTDQAPVPRLQPIPVETPRAPPTHDVTQEGATKKVKEEMKVETTAKKGQQEVVTVKEQQEVVTVKEQQEVVTVKEQQEVVTVKEQQEAVTVKGQQKAMTVKGQHEVVTVKGQKEAVTIQGEMEEEEEVLEEEPSEGEEEKEESSSHIYESIQDLNIDLDALIGRDSSHKQEVDDETPAPPQEALCLIYANVPVKKHLIIPPPPSDPAPAAPGPAPSFSGFSSSGLSPASPLSPLDEWQTHTDADSGKLFYYHPLTRHSTWTQPPSAGAHLDAGPAPSQPLPEEDYPQDSQDDSVFTSNPQLLIPRAHLDSKYDAFRRISELPAMPQRMMGNGVSEEGAVSTRTWRHSVAEDKFYSSKGHAPDSLQLPDRLKLKRNLSNRSTGSNQQHVCPALIGRGSFSDWTRVTLQGHN